MLLNLMLIFQFPWGCNAQKPSSAILTDEQWWQELSEEWKQIFVINYNLYMDDVDIFKIGLEHLNRSVKSGEDSVSLMNTSVSEYHKDSHFKLSYQDFYARAVRTNHVKVTREIDLKEIPKIKKFYMVSGPSDLEPLKRMPDLEVLIMNYCGISNGMIGNHFDCQSIGSLKKLRILNLVSSSVKNIKCISSLTELEELDISYTQIEDIKGIEKLDKLKMLSCGSRIKNISRISKLKNLEFLKINGAKHIPDLSALKNLRSLAIQENEMSIVDGSYRINNIEFLSQLQSLEFLDIEMTSYHGDLRELNNLTKLKAIAIPSSVKDNDVNSFIKSHPEVIIINAHEFSF